MPELYWPAFDGADVWNMILGEYCSCFSDRIRPTPSSKTAPCAIRSGFLAAIWLAMDWKFVVSAGYVWLKTVLTPSASSCFCMDSMTGAANGSSWVGYAAVFGRWSAGSDLTQLTNTSAWCGAVACRAKNRPLNPRGDIFGAPPAGSTKTIWFFSATADAGKFSSEENVPSTR